MREVAPWLSLGLLEMGDPPLAPERLLRLAVCHDLKTPHPAFGNLLFSAASVP